MPSIFNLIGEYNELYELLTEDEEDEKVVKDTLEAIQGEIEVKAEGLLTVADRLEMEMDACEKHYKAWKRQYDTRKKNYERLRTMIANALTEMNVKELKAGDRKVKLVNNGGVKPLVFDESKTVPERFTKLTIENDTKLIREALDRGEELDFVHYGERGVHVKF